MTSEKIFLPLPSAEKSPPREDNSFQPGEHRRPSFKTRKSDVLTSRLFFFFFFFSSSSLSLANQLFFFPPFRFSRFFPSFFIYIPFFHPCLLGIMIRTPLVHQGLKPPRFSSRLKISRLMALLHPASRAEGRKFLRL